LRCPSHAILAGIPWERQYAFFVEVGEPKGASGGLSKLRAQEALIVARCLRQNGVQDLRIYDARSGASLTENQLKAIAETERI
jgi:hypothetical protein